MLTIILLGGYPGAGKTKFVKEIMKTDPELILVNQDEIEERFFEDQGFDNQEEKDILIERSRQIYYGQLEGVLMSGRSIITDYPFSYKQKPVFEYLKKKYNCAYITVRLVGDMKTLYQRRIKRDLCHDRCLAHMMTHYHAGDKMEDRRNADFLLTYKQFEEKCKTSGYAEFYMGDLIPVDVTDFSTVDYDGITARVINLLEKIN
jgi:Zeta toxin.